MINPKNKRVQVTLPGETVELLESLSKRYNKTFSETVKWAINVLGAQRKHNFVIKLREQNEDETYNGMSEQKFKSIINKLEPESLSEEDKELLEEFKDR